MNEIIPIVDESDQMIDTVEKANFDKTTGRIYRTVSLFLFDNHGRILIQRRAFSKKTYPGKWDFAAVAGHVAAGETYLQAIERETEEEIGLRNVRFFEAAKDFTETPEGKRRFTQVFWAVENFGIEELQIPKNEVDEVRLVSVAELKQMFEENRADFANYDGWDNFEKIAERIGAISKEMSKRNYSQAIL
ncbi:MAG: NUDIX domain-containing protein [bacterium]|nr:NUDIX domain-containing protein [bacterium]